jgi:hypothetical protein
MIVYDVKLYVAGSKRRPYSQGLHCPTHLLCATTFGSPVPLSFEYNSYVTQYFVNSGEIAPGVNERQRYVHCL